MTARSRALFWGLSSILALLLLTTVGVVGRRAWQVEDARRAVASPDVDVRFLYSGPKWLEPALPKFIANAWFSSTHLLINNRTTHFRRFNDDDWEAALPDIKRLPDIVWINMRQAEIGRPTLESFVDFPQLRSLALIDSGIADPELEPLSQCTQLETLWLSFTQVTDDGLSHLTGLTNLQELGLDGTQITEDGLVHLRKLTKLKELSVSQTGLPESALMSLEVDMPGLMISDD